MPAFTHFTFAANKKWCKSDSGFGPTQLKAKQNCSKARLHKKWTSSDVWKGGGNSTQTVVAADDEDGQNEDDDDLHAVFTKSMS